MVELAARMERAEDGLDGGPFGLGMDIHGNAAAVVRDRDAAVSFDGKLDFGAVSVQGLIDGVVENLPHEMMEAARIRGTDIHGWPLSDGLKPLKNSDVFCGIGSCQTNLPLPLNRHSGIGLSGRQ